MSIDERKELSRLFMQVFMHAGYVNEVFTHWEKEDLIHMDVSLVPWSDLGDVEEVTGVLLEAGSIVDETHRYFRFKDGTEPVRVRMSIDLADPEWHQTMIKRISLIIAAEMKKSAGQR
jgi:hypothetical protein